VLPFWSPSNSRDYFRFRDSNDLPQILFIGWCQTFILMKLIDESHSIISLTQKPQFLQFLNT